MGTSGKAELGHSAVGMEKCIWLKIILCMLR